MPQANKSKTIATGLAMFSMFFGAGNVVFPLALGQIAQDKNFFAIIGMLITAVGVPFTGLIAMTLFDGDYKRFFGRLGIVPGFLIAAFIMGLIGPFGAIPRCIALSYSTAKTLMPGVSLPVFSGLACFLIWLLTYKRSSILDTLGYYLTPLLIGSLAIIIVKGLLSSPDVPVSDHESFDIFMKGFIDGYQTMDLLGAFFFSSVIIVGLKSGLSASEIEPRKLLKTTLKAIAIGASLLAITYIGFSYVSSFNSSALTDVPSDELISMIAIHVLGPYASVIATVAVALACLTTAIALAAVFAEFIYEDLTFKKVGYSKALIITLVITFFVSTLDFKGIAAFISPILTVIYPALILLSILNILYVLWSFKPVKTPFALAVLLSIGYYFWL